ncbi:RNA-binding protein FUS-like [Pecten maximus]|uniref:RNA-binding protein FUS-like n=1 Tax=Pecten maximus TaxID=6579 RepID=UPI0014581175|nr:RNA-binding protein FUS-like [Pecten maximus]
MSNKGADVHQDSTENKSPSVDSRGPGQHSEQSSQKPLAESVTKGSVGQGQSSEDNSQQTLTDSGTQGSGGLGQSSEDSSQQTLADSDAQGSGGQGQSSEDSIQQTLADSGTQRSGGQGQNSEDSSQQTLADSGTQRSGGQGQSSEDSSQQTLADSGTQGSGGQGQSSKDSSQQTADSGTQGSGGQGQSSEDSQQTLADSGTKQSGGQGEEAVDKDTGNRLKSVGTQVVQRTVIQDYLEFLGLICTTKNYRFGLIMHTSVTIAVLVSWSVIWQPATDFFCYEVFKYPRPLELDPREVTNFMEQYNPECNLTELQTNYNKLEKKYLSLQNNVSYLQGNAEDFNKRLVNHAEQIQNTSVSVKNVGSNMTEVKGQLRHQSEQTHRVQRDIDQTILKQIAEEPWKYISIIVAVGEVFLVVYVMKLKSSLRDIGRQPQAVVQPPKSFDKQHTNGFKATKVLRQAAHQWI